MARRHRSTEKFDLCLAIRALIENEDCPLLDDEGQASGGAVKIVMATIEIDGTILVDMADGERFVVSIRRPRR